MNSTDTKEYLTSEEVATKFDVPEQTVRDWATNGHLIARKVGARWFFPKDQFEEEGPAKIVCDRCGEEITGYQDEAYLAEGRATGNCQDCIEKDHSAYPS